MTNLVVLIPVALFLGFTGLLTFVWALRSGQYEDLDGAAARVLLDDPEAKAHHFPGLVPSDPLNGDKTVKPRPGSE